jgi:simple sugar transport system substrate-binding protein
LTAQTLEGWPNWPNRKFAKKEVKSKVRIKTGILVYILLVVLLASFTYLSLKPRKHFPGVRIVFFNGGPLGCPFATVVYNGARAAEKDLGCKVEYIWSDWNPATMAQQFKAAIAGSPDAICMMGHPGTDVLSPLIDEAVRKGIIVTLQNVDLPEIRKQYIDKGCGYAGQELYGSGVMLGKGAVRKFGLVKGDKGLVVGPGITRDKQALNERAMRTKGCIDALEEGGLTVYAIPFTPEVDKNAAEYGFDYFKAALDMYPDVKVIITDHGGVTAAIGPILKKMGKKPGEIIAAGFDLSMKTVAAIKSGYVGLVHDQQPYLQGYLPVLQACLAKKYGFSGLYIDTGVGLIDSSNIEAVAELAKIQIR